MEDLLAGTSAGDQADGAAIDQRLAEVALVEHDGAVDGGDAGLVAAVFHAFAHAFEDAAGMEQAGGQGFVMEGGREAEHVGVADEFRAEAGAHRVAVHPHDAGQRPAVGVEGEGLLCVSTLMQASYSGVKAMTPALSLNTERQKSLSPRLSRICLVVFMMQVL